MDPVTAILLLITEGIKLVNEQMKGATAEQKKIMWDWFIEDQKFWRELLKKMEIKFND